MDRPIAVAAITVYRDSRPPVCTQCNKSGIFKIYIYIYCIKYIAAFSFRTMSSQNGF